MARTGQPCRVCWVNMSRLNPAKLHVTYLTGNAACSPALPRRYTLTHSDLSGDLFLSIGSQYDIEKTAGFYTRLMRDEVLAELINPEEGPLFKVYCHVSGGLVLGSARWRYKIFKAELPLAMEALRQGDHALFAQHPELDKTQVNIYFTSANIKYNRMESWGTLADYVIR